MTSRLLLLNADMGESFGPWVMGMDQEVMPHVDLANVACGFHASDPDVIRQTVRLAARHGVRVGAHPAYPDLVGFGRRSLACSAQEIENLVLYQLGALAGVCRAEGLEVSYVKPHGALYNDMARDQEIMSAVMRAILAFDSSLPLLTMATRDTSTAADLARQHGVNLWFEAFADRAYDGAGRLVSRREPGAVHHDPEVIVDQAVRIASGEPLVASDGSELTLTADTLCVHGDNPESIAAVKAIREALNRLGAGA
ncbi:MULTISPECIES: 5-oxoprolinase subunit PxpA [unclassified Halomonas]|uniref:5-oxoprolinase subunit PxpA n=1 Tax=unclassified Halomonas TaxID=2609666 RepID=UPI0028860DB0|nr:MULTISPECIES: 5-oxoprolinase subunit PxpA [unclassified Halomonas]MDT0500432.1 5-oxoprolinase subunit PxpA [Halomonas sp. PAR7]MDT0511671.1 5-oxoprolinase subunit PxpA [Halomonas sp. LES1]MDT0590041.1 5-oxoprolinase subunit PxpA [Halomonas sp. PAR8]